MRTLGLLVFYSFSLGLPFVAAAQSSMDLSGEWTFRMDPKDVGVSEEWFKQEFSHGIRIPGVLQEQGYGDIPNVDTPWIVRREPMERMESYPNWFTHPMFAKYRGEANFTFPYWLQPERHYIGTAWYQTVVSIPEDWNGQDVSLFLERCRWVSELWVNSEYVSRQDSLGTPHLYSVADFLSPGQNVITLRVDGSMVIDIGYHAHSVSDQTQMTWNGIIGEVKLVSEPLAILKQVQAYPDMASGSVRFEIELGDVQLNSEKYFLRISGRTENSPINKRILPVQFPLPVSSEAEPVIMNLGPDYLKWDEHNPNLYNFRVEVVEAATDVVVQEKSVRIGMREIEARDGRFYLNGRPIFLRGTLNCAEFPLRGYPEMDVESWRRIFRACKDYGLNHVRFHSWCPPEAAFTAADELGIYLQPEVSEWVYVHEPEQIEFLKRESKRMLESYGNHPSFAFMGLGNEAGVVKEHRNDFINIWKEDLRRLYTLKANANNSFTDAYDYQIAYEIDDKKIRIQAGWLPEPMGSTIVAEAPETVYNYESITSTRGFPLVAHETVQRCSYPNPGDIEKFTGNLQPGYLVIARDQLEERGMSHLVPAFVEASGKWQVQQFKDEIEAHLRTEPMGGFQLLSIQDFPGQGTALVGVLDLFWEPKGYVSGEAFREFCSDTVPLALLEKRIYLNNEAITGMARVSYYGEADSPRVAMVAKLLDESNTILQTLNLGEQALARGLNDFGAFNFKVDTTEHGRQLTLLLECSGDVSGINRWNVWQFADVEVDSKTGDTLVVRQLTPEILEQVKSGQSVLVLPELDEVRGDIPQCFSSMYWNCPWTDGGETHTLGILCDDSHPVFKWFPTSTHTDWQWWSLLTRARPMILDEWGADHPWPKSYQPIIQPIDGWNLNRKLSLLAEFKHGSGRVMVCGIDLSSDLEARPEARALMKGILEYMDSEAFEPEIAIDAATVLGLFKD